MAVDLIMFDIGYSPGCAAVFAHVSALRPELDHLGRGAFDPFRVTRLERIHPRDFRKARPTPRNAIRIPRFDWTGGRVGRQLGGLTAHLRPPILPTRRDRRRPGASRTATSRARGEPFLKPPAGSWSPRSSSGLKDLPRVPSLGNATQLEPPRSGIPTGRGPKVASYASRDDFQPVRSSCHPATATSPLILRKRVLRLGLRARPGSRKPAPDSARLLRMLPCRRLRLVLAPALMEPPTLISRSLRVPTRTLARMPASTRIGSTLGFSSPAAERISSAAPPRRLASPWAPPMGKRSSANTSRPWTAAARAMTGARVMKVLSSRRPGGSRSRPRHRHGRVRVQARGPRNQSTHRRAPGDCAA
jgi:hypothetical protein